MTAEIINITAFKAKQEAAKMREWLESWPPYIEDKDNITGKYILVDKVPVPETNLLKWAQWNENHQNKIVKQDYKKVGKQKKRLYWVSTVFLGLDHNFARGIDPDSQPILFETMVFNHTKGHKRKMYDLFMERYCTWQEAEQGHQQTLDNLAHIVPDWRKVKKLKRKGLA